MLEDARHHKINLLRKEFLECNAPNDEHLARADFLTILDRLSKDTFNREIFN